MANFAVFFNKNDGKGMRFQGTIKAESKTQADNKISNRMQAGQYLILELDKNGRGIIEK